MPISSNLSEGKITIDPRLLIQGNKSVSNFYLGNWAKKRSLLQTLKAAKQAQAFSGRELSSQIQQRFEMENAQQAWEFYLQNMTGGKILLKMDSGLE